jgi:hypothetical protein
MTRPVEISAQGPDAGRPWSSLAPAVANLGVACVLTSRLDDTPWSIRHQVYRHRFHSCQRIACKTDKRSHIGMTVHLTHSQRHERTSAGLYFFVACESACWVLVGDVFLECAVEELVAAAGAA